MGDYTITDFIGDVTGLATVSLGGGIAAKAASQLAKKAAEAVTDQGEPPVLREFRRLEHHHKLPEKYLREFTMKRLPLTAETIARYMPVRQECVEFDPLHYAEQLLLSSPFLLGAVAVGGYTDEFVERCAGKTPEVDAADILRLGAVPLLMNPLTMPMGMLFFWQADQFDKSEASNLEKTAEFLGELAADFATFGAYRIGKSIIKEVQSQTLQEEVMDLGLKLMFPGAW